MVLIGGSTVRVATIRAALVTYDVGAAVTTVIERTVMVDVTVLAWVCLLSSLKSGSLLRLDVELAMLG